MPRVALDWRLSAIDVDSVAGLVAALDRESRRLGLGSSSRPAGLAIRDKRWVSDELISAHPIGGFHHMGTTRMASDPRRGVTDGWGRVHGLPNLHIAGSSLFPTGGLGQSDPDHPRPGAAHRGPDRRRASGRSAGAQAGAGTLSELRARASCSAMTARVTACIRSWDAPSVLLGTVMIAIA